MSAERTPVTDTRGRQLRDLRISVTDRCNFRCAYCMPREVFGPDFTFLDRSELLSFEEITRIVRVAAGLGVRKLRLTGGEPLLRRDIDHLVASLAAVEGIEDLAMTTNGSLLERHAERLRAAGLRRLTVSLDSLDDATFRAMSDTAVPVQQVLDGITAAGEAGFDHIKVNCVLRAGTNDDGIVDMVSWARREGVTVRFIEFMDVGTTNGWSLREVVPAAEVVQRIDAVFPLEPVGQEPVLLESAQAEGTGGSGEVAQRWRFRDGTGEVGVISSVSQPFCATCTRARLSAVGELYTCLFAAAGNDLRALLRSGADDEALTARMRAIWRVRTDAYSEARSDRTAGLPRVEMSYIGG